MDKGQRRPAPRAGVPRPTARTVSRVSSLPPFGAQMILTFCLAFGVVLGGSVLGSLGGLLTGFPGRTMWRLAGQLKPWAVVAALGEDVAAFWYLEQGILKGQILDLGKQVLLLLAAFAGAQLGAYLILAASGVRQ